MFQILPQTLTCAAPLTLYLKIRVIPTAHFNFISCIDVSRQNALGSMKCDLTIAKDYQCYICFPEFIGFPAEFTTQSNLLHSFFHKFLLQAFACSSLVVRCGVCRGRKVTWYIVLGLAFLFPYCAYLIGLLSCLRGCAGIQKSNAYF